jgi:hypothetical protein
MKKEDIETRLIELGVDNYTINEDGTVDVNTTVDISFKNLKEIPVQFGKVRGDFNCSNNQLDSLKGSPKLVGVSFFCHSNHLGSLEGGPESVGKAFVCRQNRMTSLNGAPQSIDGTFDCSANKLTSLEGAPECVNGSFDCSNNQLTSLNGIPRYVKFVLYCTANKMPKHVVSDYKRQSSFLIIGDEAE